MDPHASTVEEFFDGSQLGLDLFSVLADLIKAIGPADVRVSRSQIAFRARTGFAYAWRPDRYVRSDVPLVLSVALDRRLDSPRFTQVAHPAPTVWMHHLEVRTREQLDAEVAAWLRAAYERAS